MTSMRKMAAALGLGLTVAATAVLADAHADKAAQAAVKARNAQMSLIAYNIGLLGAIAKGEVEYDAAIATSAATNLHAAAAMDRATLWIEGTEQGAAADSRAKAEIWSDAAGFDAKFNDLINASAAMKDSAGNGVEAIQASIGPVGGACKACHETYRGPEN